MATLAQITENIRRNTEDKAKRYSYRITWIDGAAHLQRCPVGGTYNRDGEIVRPATPEDRQAMYEGRISYDPETDPSALAWRKHVDEGGD